MKALVFDRFGGPEVLRVADVAAPDPMPGHAVVRMRAVGLNFADVYRRRGSYHLEGQPPYILGYEGAGEIESLRAGGDSLATYAFCVGDRVAFADAPHANAELVRVPLDKLIPLPDRVSFESAAAQLLQGLTAQYLVCDSRKLADGETAVVHAAAGGVGLLLVQLARRAGARVLALSSTRDKLDRALAVGATAGALYDDDWVATAHRLSPDGRGADVVYDSVGATLDDSLRAARRGGQVVFFGMAGGDPVLVDPRRLMDESKTLTGGDLWNVLTSHEQRLRRAANLFAAELQIHIAGTFRFADAAAAHRALEGRGTSGKILLVP